MLCRFYPVTNQSQKTEYKSSQSVNMWFSLICLRLKLGPCESDSKIFIMERNSTPEISAEVAELMHVPEPILNEMLSRLRAIVE